MRCLALLLLAACGASPCSEKVKVQTLAAMPPGSTCICQDDVEIPSWVCDAPGVGFNK